MDESHTPGTGLGARISALIRQGNDARLDRRASSLSERFAKSPRATVDYSIHALSFLYLYYCANFAKASVVASGLDVPAVDTLSILDLGTGSGAGVAGFVDGLSRQTRSPPSVRITGIDTSPRQLSLFDRLSRPYIDSRYPGPVDISLEQREIESVTPTELGEFDYVFDSHALTELPDAVTAELVQSIAGIGVTGPRLVMIEQPDTGLFDVASRHMQPVAPSPTIRRLDLSVPTPLLHVRASTPPHSEGKLCYSTFSRSAR